MNEQDIIVRQIAIVRQVAAEIHFPWKEVAKSRARFMSIASQQNIQMYVLNELAWDDDHEVMHERLLWALFIWRRVINVQSDGRNDARLMMLINRLSMYFHLVTDDTRRVEQILEHMVQRHSTKPPAPKGVRRSEPPQAGALG